MGTFTFLVLIVASFNAGLPMLFGGRGFGFGGIGGGGGGRFGFLLAPPGPVFLRPVNASTRWADILEDTVQQALDHCKSVRLCNATGWATRYDSDCSECHPCACDDACYQRGDCCVDKLLRDAGRPAGAGLRSAGRPRVGLPQHLPQRTTGWPPTPSWWTGAWAAAFQTRR